MKKKPLVKSINWNVVEDELDKVVWDSVKTQIWYPEEISVSNDRASWRTMNDDEKTTLARVFAGLTRLDSLQTIGVAALMPYSNTQHEEAVLAGFTFFEAIHAQSYSYVFQTLLTMDEITSAHDWADNNEFLNKKIEIVQRLYETLDGKDHLLPLKKRAISVLLESFLFYSGFYYPLYLNSRSKLTNTCDIIQLIIRDESMHGAYIGSKFRQLYADLSEDDQGAMTEFVYDQMYTLYENELNYSTELYEDLGLLDDVRNYLLYNANKALQNLGFAALYNDVEINPVILNGISLNNTNHDFFSQKGSNYVKIEFGEMTEDEWVSDNY